MAKFLAGHSTSSVKIRFHFSASDDQESASPLSLATYVLSYLLKHPAVKAHQKYQGILEALESLCSESHNCDNRRFGKLWPIIDNIFHFQLEFTIIVDALDECHSGKDLDDLLSALKALASMPDGRVIVLSRDLENLREALSDSVAIEMDTNVVAPDINLYLNSMIDRNKELQPLRSDILARANDACGGQFQWAVMMLKSLRTAPTRKKQREKLRQFPPGLCDAYAKLMIESGKLLDEDDLHLRRQMFLLLLNTCRLLSLAEFATALALQDSCPYLDNEDEILDIGKEVKRLCWPLATVTQGYVRLVHMSVKGFLVEKPKTSLGEHGLYMTFEESNALLARKCLAKLSLDQYRAPYRIAPLLRKNAYPEYITAESNDCTTCPACSPIAASSSLLRETDGALPYIISPTTCNDKLGQISVIQTLLDGFSQQGQRLMETVSYTDLGVPSWRVLLTPDQLAMVKACSLVSP